MSHYGWANCPENVRAQVISLVDAWQEALNGNLVGIYLHGSLALGCFNPAQSDLDLLIVVRHGLLTRAKRRLAELLLHQSLAPCPVEVSVLSLAHLEPWIHPAPYDYHYSEAWRPKQMAQLLTGEWQQWNNHRLTDPDLAAHVTITLRRGLCLHGQPIPLVFPSVPPEHYRASLLEDFAWAKARLPGGAVYFVLNACRIYAYLAEGLICSKAEGGAWALAHLPEQQHPLVASALEAYASDQGMLEFESVELERFVAAMTALILPSEAPARV
jgi:predicted nucleotidyltransferase